MIDPELGTVAAMTAVVVIACAVVFLVDTAKRTESQAGSMWSGAFFAALLVQFCALVRAVAPELWAATAIANAADVTMVAFIWLGCRRFNRRALTIAGPVVAVGVVASLVAALVAGADAGYWAGAPVTTVVTAVFALLGAVEAAGGRMRLDISGIGLTVVLAQLGLFAAGRAAAFVLLGPDDPVFITWFGPVPTATVTIVLLIVGVVTMSVLRASESGLGARRGVVQHMVSDDGFLVGDIFARVLADLLDRASRASVRAGVIALRVDEVTQVAAAFGQDEAERILVAWRQAVWRSAPPASILGVDGATCILIAFHPTSHAEARRVAGAVRARAVSALAAAGLVVTPQVAVGVALTDSCGYDADAIIGAAESAAQRSAVTPDLSIAFAGEE